MRKTTTSLLLLFSLLLGACSALGGDGSSAPSLFSSRGNDDVPHTLSVQGRGTVTLAPDIATISIGVQTENANAQEAVAANNSQSQAVVEALETFGISGNDLRTTNFSVFPIQERNFNNEVISTTFRVNNTITVKVRNLDDLGAVLDAVVTAGANNINNIRFEIDPTRQTGAYNQALQAAIEDALTTAELMASAAGVQLVDVQTISASSGGIVEQFEVRSLSVAADSFASAPISPGENEVTVTVFVVYEIQLYIPPPAAPTAAPEEEPAEGEDG